MDEKEVFNKFGQMLELDKARNGVYNERLNQYSVDEKIRRLTGVQALEEIESIDKSDSRVKIYKRGSYFICLFIDEDNKVHIKTNDLYYINYTTDLNLILWEIKKEPISRKNITEKEAEKALYWRRNI